MTPRNQPGEPIRPGPKRNVAAGSSAEASPPKKKQKGRGAGGQWSKACIACRRKKTKCDGNQPCATCVKSRGNVCSYSSNEFATNHAGTLLVEAFDILRKKSPQERADAFEYLATTSDATLIMSRLRLNLRAEDNNSIRKDFESLELQDRHSFVYAPHNPPELHKLDGVVKKLVEWPGESVAVETRLAIYQSLFPSIVDNPPPTPTPQFDDPRLRGPFLKPWTSVEIADDLATKVLRYYLNTDHPLYGPFHAETFIRDMVSQSYTYCSSLLVNSLMYWACRNYAAIDPSAQSMVGPFCEEAEIGWEIERFLPTRLTMVAGVFLSLGHLAQGKTDAIHYLKEALSIGSEMGLYKGGSYEIVEEQWEPEEANAAAYAAWGVFNVAMMMTTFYFQFNIDYPCSLPCLKIPRDPRKMGPDPPTSTPEESPRDSPEEPPEDSPEGPPETPEWYSDVFDSACRFWSIMHEVAVEYGRDPEARASKPPSLMFAEYKFRELLVFGDKLRKELMHQKNSPPCVSLFHVWYHCAVLSIFRPFLVPGQTSGHELKTFTTEGATPESVATASVSQLKRLILDYRLRHEAVGCSFNWQTGMLYLMFALLKEEPGAMTDFYFCLCLYGYKKLANFPVIEKMAGSFVSLMVLNGHIVEDKPYKKFSEVWKGIQDKCKEARENTGGMASFLLDSEESMQSATHAPLMVDLHLAMTKPEEATAEYLAVSCEINFLTDDWASVLT